MRRSFFGPLRQTGRKLMRRLLSLPIGRLSLSAREPEPFAQTEEWIALEHGEL